MTPDILPRLRGVDPYDFEHFVADVWSERGWTTEVSQGSNDMGVDVIARKSDGLVDQQIAIQVKRYAEGNTVGRPQIQQYHALKTQNTETDAVVVVTTSTFAETAEEWAAAHNVKLVDGADLVKIIEGNDLTGLVEEYAPKQSSGSGSILGGLEELLSGSTEAAEVSDAPSGSNDSTASSASSLDADTWGRAAGMAAVGTAAQVFAVLVWAKPDAVPLTSPDAWLVFFAGWLTVPPAVFLDTLKLHRQDAEKRLNRFTWPVGVFVAPVLVPVFYLVFRA